MVMKTPALPFRCGLAAAVMSFLASMGEARAVGIFLDVQSYAGINSATVTYNPDIAPYQAFTAIGDSAQATPSGNLGLPGQTSGSAGTIAYGWSGGLSGGSNDSISGTQASASLAQAALHASHSDNGSCTANCNTNPSNAARGYAFASLQDIVTFQKAGAAVGTPIQVGLTFTMHGTFFGITGVGASGFAGAGIHIGPNVGSNFYVASMDATQDPGGSPVFTTDTGGGGNLPWINPVFSPAGDPLNRVFTADFIAQSGVGTNLIEQLILNCAEGTLCDYSNTSWFTFTLPEGVTLLSESGVLLTDPIPEPAALTVFAAGLAGLVLARRRRGQDASIH